MQSPDYPKPTTWGVKARIPANQLYSVEACLENAASSLDAAPPISVSRAGAGGSLEYSLTRSSTAIGQVSVTKGIQAGLITVGLDATHDVNPLVDIAAIGELMKRASARLDGLEGGSSVFTENPEALFNPIYADSMPYTVSLSDEQTVIKYSNVNTPAMVAIIATRTPIEHGALAWGFSEGLSKLLPYFAIDDLVEDATPESIRPKSVNGQASPLHELSRHVALGLSNGLKVGGKFTLPVQSRVRPIEPHKWYSDNATVAIYMRTAEVMEDPLQARIKELCVALAHLTVYEATKFTWDI